MKHLAYRKAAAETIRFSVQFDHPPRPQHFENKGRCLRGWRQYPHCLSIVLCFKDIQGGIQTSWVVLPASLPEQGGACLSQPIAEESARRARGIVSGEGENTPQARHRCAARRATSSRKLCCTPSPRPGRPVRSRTRSARTIPTRETPMSRRHFPPCYRTQNSVFWPRK